MQSFEIEIEEDIFVGMPFVLLSNGRWIKNNGSDFYIEFSRGSKHVQKVVISFVFQQVFFVLCCVFHQFN